MTEFLDDAIMIMFFVSLIIHGKRIDLLESMNSALKETGIMMAEEIDRLRVRVKELEGER